MESSRGLECLPEIYVWEEGGCVCVCVCGIPERSSKGLEGLVKCASQVCQENSPSPLIMKTATALPGGHTFLFLFWLTISIT